MTTDDAMNGTLGSGRDPLRELGFALAEADAERPGPGLADRVRATALAGRDPGRPSVPPEAVSGLEAFRRATTAMTALLAELTRGEWARPALRGLDVQGLLGHLIGVEAAFVGTLAGDPVAGTGDHVASTDAHARAQEGRAPADTLAEWRGHVARSLEGAAARDPGAEVTFYGITLPLDELLVVRAFELWVHEEDIRRATGRPLVAPDEGRLARMTSLAMVLLPAGVAGAAGGRPGGSARLVLTGPGGGTWDMDLDRAPRETRRTPSVRVVVDAAAFCRVVGNRADIESSGALVTGDRALAIGVFAGAAALALD